MAEIIFPSQLKHAKSTFRYVDSTGLVRGAYTGAAQTTAYGGDRFGASIDIAPVGGIQGQADRAVLMAWLVTLKGKQNRAWMWDQSYIQRGSFPSAELLTNNTFQNGTTGWSTDTQYSIAVSDRSLRATRTAVTAAQIALSNTAAVTVTQYSAYAVRFLLTPNRGSFSTFRLRFGSSSAGEWASVGSLGNAGLLSISSCALGSSAVVALVDEASSGLTAGDSFEVPFASLSQCIQVDNSPNDLQQSEAFDTSPWVAASGTTGATITANSTTDPKGGNVADAIVENNATSAHFVKQAYTMISSAHDRVVWCCCKAGIRNFALLAIDDGSTTASQYFNLNTGAVGVNGSTGANWANRRAFITSLGNGWYHCAMVVQKTGSSTGGTVFIQIASADGTQSYTGSNGSTGIYAWRGGTAASSFPVRPNITTSSANSSGTAQTGGALNVKGLPVSTNGLLLPGDRVQCGNQPVTVTAPLNSNAAGLGYLQFSPPLRVSPSDSDPIIVNQPMGKFIFTGTFPEWDNVPGVFTMSSVDLEESCD